MKLWLGGGVAPFKKLPKLIVCAVWLATGEREALQWSMTVKEVVAETLVAADAPGRF